MDIRAEEISKIIREQIGSFAVTVDVAEVGTRECRAEVMPEDAHCSIRTWRTQENGSFEAPVS